MRSPSLTRKTKHKNGRIVSTYEWRSHRVDVCDSARNAILVNELFSDEELAADEKAELLVCMLFPNPRETVELAGEYIGELLAVICWDAFGIDIAEDHPHAAEYEPPVFDWDEDAARIKASLLQAYGLNWDNIASEFPYADMCALLGMLLEADTETPFQQAIYYRTAKPPKRTKYNADLCNAFEARQQHFALEKADDSTQSENDKTADMFAAMKRAAQRGA